MPKITPRKGKPKKGDKCRACGGTGKSSKGGSCYPCDGKGIQK